jgi:hypothetical protein
VGGCSECYVAAVRQTTGCFIQTLDSRALNQAPCILELGVGGRNRTTCAFRRTKFADDLSWHVSVLHYGQISVLLQSVLTGLTARRWSTREQRSANLSAHGRCVPPMMSLVHGFGAMLFEKDAGERHASGLHAACAWAEA